MIARSQVSERSMISAEVDPEDAERFDDRAVEVEDAMMLESAAVTLVGAK